MQRTIVVKGEGSLSLKPNMVEISLTLESLKKDYEETVKLANQKIEQIQYCLSKIGFKKEDLKTTRFNVNSKYKSVRNENGDYTSVFEGFLCNHQLKLKFDFNKEKLAEVLSVIAKSEVDPKFYIAFTVKDSEEVEKELLKDICESARRKAELLCEASNVKLGQLVNIEYNWGEINIYSRTNYDTCLKGERRMAKAAAIEIEPEDIEVRDTATLVWEII